MTEGIKVEGHYCANKAINLKIGDSDYKLVGHIQSMKFTNGDFPITNTIKVPDPENPGADKVEKIAVLEGWEGCNWNSGEATSAMTLSPLLDEDNCGALQDGHTDQLGGKEIEIEFYGYKYHEGTEKFFKYVDCDGKALKFILLKAPEISLEPYPGLANKLYLAKLTLSPKGEQTIIIRNRPAFPKPIQIGAGKA